MDLIVDGRTVFAATGGRRFDPSLPAVVLVHGAGMDHSVWALQSRGLAHRGRAVLAVDLPGHGRSAGPPLRAIRDMADWLVRLLDAAGVGGAVLAGHSMGALGVLATAARHPGRVQALALIGAAARMPVHPALLEAAEADDPAAIGMIVAWAFGPRAELGGSPVPGLWMAGSARRLLERAAPGVLFADLAACNAYPDGEAAARAVRCPARVILGTQDRMTPPKAARALAALIPGAATETISDAGHMPMTEMPDRVLEALERIG